MQLLHPAGREIRDKFSGAVEAFSKKQGSGSSTRDKHRSYEEAPSSKDVVNSNFLYK